MYSLSVYLLLKQFPSIIRVKPPCNPLPHINLTLLASDYIDKCIELQLYLRVLVKESCMRDFIVRTPFSLQFFLFRAQYGQTYMIPKVSSKFKKAVFAATSNYEKMTI